MLLGNWRHRRPAEAVVVTEADADGRDDLANGLRVYGEENLGPNA
jgi:hypothetical protein